MSNLLDALIAKYNGDIMSAKANIKVYNENPTGIGEHPDLVAALDSEVAKLADAEDKLESVLKLKEDKSFLTE